MAVFYLATRGLSLFSNRGLKLRFSAESCFVFGVLGRVYLHTDVIYYEKFLLLFNSKTSWKFSLKFENFCEVFGEPLR